jgi:cyclophilin family peptidyl-prolyl cis-trans isomerase
MRARAILAALAATTVTLLASRAAAQPPARLAILVAEDRRAPAPRDVAVIRAGLHSKDADTCRVAVRALGRLERPSLISDIVPLLKSSWPEVRAEAANAIGQAAQGWKGSVVNSDSVALTALIAIDRLAAEADPGVRAALCQTLSRLPYTTEAQVHRAEAAIIQSLSRADTVEGQLGVAQGLEGLIRLNGKLTAPSPAAVATLERLASGTAANGARVRRVAFEALIITRAAGADSAASAASAGAARRVTDTLIVHGLADPDAQVRRLALKAIESATEAAPLGSEVRDAAQKALLDESAIVRLEALRAASSPGAPDGRDDACPAYLQALGDRDAHVALAAIDGLGSCGQSPEGPEAIDRLERTVNDLSGAGSPRGWHANAHAIVALASAAPDKAKAALPQFVGSTVSPMRMYAARAAAVLEDTSTLEKLAADADDNVCEAAIEGLSKLEKHGADAIYTAALGRHGYQVIRLAARALAAPPLTTSTATLASAVPALKAALRRLDGEGRDNSRDARVAIVDALHALSVQAPAITPVRQAQVASQLNAAELRRLASARARITIRQVGVFELALFTSEAPASVTRFARLAESGYYNGLTFHRVVPNFVIQGGSPGANEYIGDATFMRDEVGLWPHVRGAVGMSTRGRDTGDAQIFVDLVDNPRLDHEYTVFAQVLNGMDVVDRILEGDVIERIEIVF